MMTLDEQVLAEAREVRQRLVDLESPTAHARVDYHHAIKKLHAAGGSPRAIAAARALAEPGGAQPAGRAAGGGGGGAGAGAPAGPPERRGPGRGSRAVLRPSWLGARPPAR